MEWQNRIVNSQAKTQHKVNQDNNSDDVPFLHYNDVTMSAMASQITSVSIVSQLLVQAQIKEYIKAPHHWPWCGEFTGDRWIPRTRPVTRKVFTFDDVIMLLLWCRRHALYSLTWNRDLQSLCGTSSCQCRPGDYWKWRGGGGGRHFENCHE